ncbi:MFS transporter [Gordonia sp. NPDC003376]
MTTRPSTGTDLTPGVRLRARKAAVAAGYAAQGLGYAAVMTALPTFQDTWGIDETGVSLILLGTCVMAGLGSVAADLVAVRWGSRVAVCAALAVQTVAIATMAIAPAYAVFLAAVIVYGIGLGTMDAAVNMQGAMLEARTGIAHLGRFYAAYTAAAALGAVAMSGFLSSSAGAVGALFTAVAVQIAVAAFGFGALDPSRERAVAKTDPGASENARPALPRRAIWVVGVILMAAYMLDSAVSTWSTVYLTEAFDGVARLAPLGYALYQATTLISRLITDRLEMRWGVTRLAIAAIVIGPAGCIVIAAVPTFAGAVTGFAIAGVAVGMLVPVTFAAAGRILPARRDEVIARVNLFNYVGVILGAVTIGAIASGSGIGPAFLIPAAGLVAVIPAARRMHAHTGSARPGAVVGGRSPSS